MAPKKEMKDLPRLPLSVSFQNLDVYGTYSASSYQTTVASYARALLDSLVALLRRDDIRGSHILRSFEGAVRSGEMLLVLGRPGSGCSTLLKTLSGELRGLDIGSRSSLSYDGRKA